MIIMNNALLAEAGVKRPVPTTQTKRIDLILGLLVIVLYWCQLFYQLQVEWSANDQYGYGWFVPLLAAVLLWMRWGERPEPSGHSPKSKVQSPKSADQSPQSGVRGWRPGLGGLRDCATTGQQNSPQVSGFIPHPSSRFLL